MQATAGTVRFTLSPTETQVGPALRVAIQIEGGVTTPGQFAQAVRELELPQSLPGMGVIFEGAAPLWGYAMLVHAAHKFAWVATFDPRLLAGVVVQSHWLGVENGDLLPLEF